MTEERNHLGAAGTLRQRAEDALREKAAALGENLAALTFEEMQQLHHELHVHHIELEIQNEELRQTQMELDISRDRYFDIYDLAPVGYVTLSKHGLIREANLTAARLLDMTRSDLVKQPLSRYIFKEDQDSHYLHCNALLEAAAPQKWEVRLVKSDGTIFWTRMEATAARDADGSSVSLVVISDITDRKKMDAVLDFLAKYSGSGQSEGFFELLARYLAETLGMDFICIDRLEGDGLTARTVSVWCDGKFEDNLSYALKDTPCGEAVGKNVYCFPANVCQFFPRDQVLQDLRADSYVGVTLWGHNGQPIGLISVISREPLLNRQLAEDILQLVAVRAAGEMERMDSEVALRVSEERHRSILRTAVDGIWRADVLGRLIEVNETYCQMSGYSEQELLTMSIHNLESAETVGNTTAYIQKIIAQGEDRFESRQRRKDGSVFDVEVSAQYRATEGGEFVFFLHDITDRKHAEKEKARIEDQLQQAQKMEVVGRLAGGVAHDFNNMLGVVLGHTEIALEQLAPTDKLYPDLTEIHKAANRSADLTSQLLAFARKQTIAPKVMDLNDTVMGMLKMLRRLIGEHIELNWQPGLDLWPVKVDPSQIDQILANLCLNVRDAITGPGKVTIETGKAAFDKAYCHDHAGFIPGEYVRLAISDNGCGMDKEIQSHLFEPFFTTKEQGKGTGLGLATVYGIVKQNSGFINVYSEPDQGTTFMIYLPRHIGKAEQLQVEGQPEPVMRGKETVLLAEDEPAVMDLTKMLLERQGYTVLAANTPREAIQLAREHAGEIHLLMTDVVMPEMNGQDLAKNLLALYPHLKLLFTSGYTADVIAHNGDLDEGVHFIQKPFSIRGLATKVREVLDSE